VTFPERARNSERSRERITNVPGAGLAQDRRLSSRRTGRWLVGEPQIAVQGDAHPSAVGDREVVDHHREVGRWRREADGLLGEIDGHCDCCVHVASAVHRREDELLADPHERCPVRAVDASGRIGRIPVDEDAPSSDVHVADERWFALDLVDVVGQEPSLDHIGLSAPGNPMLNAFPGPPAGAIEVELVKAPFVEENDRASETRDLAERCVGDQPRADDSNRRRSPRFGARPADRGRDVARQPELTEARAAETSAFPCFAYTLLLRRFAASV
jgi:hypothetical protein